MALSSNGVVASVGEGSGGETSCSNSHPNKEKSSDVRGTFDLQASDTERKIGPDFEHCQCCLFSCLMCDVGTIQSVTNVYCMG